MAGAPQRRRGFRAVPRSRTARRVRGQGVIPPQRRRDPFNPTPQMTSPMRQRYDLYCLPGRGLTEVVTFLSEDLRVGVIGALDRGALRHAAPARFPVSIATAVRWLRSWRDDGVSAAKPRDGDRLDLSRFCTAPSFTCYVAKEMNHRQRRDRRISPRSGADGGYQ